jgi:RNA polymerase sigma-70 factor (ECF subfamily)
MVNCESASIRLESLIRKAKNGDGESLGALLQTYVNYLKLLSEAQLDNRVRQRVSSSDIVQDTLLEAHRDFGQFGGQTAPEFLSWLRRILVHNLARAVERHVLAAKRDIRRELSLDQLDRSLSQSALRLEAVLADRGRTPGSMAERQESILKLADALAGLPPDYRDVVVLRHIEGLPFKEVAQRLERSEGAARMLWLRAIDRLRQVLDKE